jgi:multiple sugar transport system permease protein
LKPRRISSSSLLNVPPFLYILVIGTYLFISAIRTSAFDYKTGNFVLVKNFAEVFSDTFLLQSLTTTLVYVSAAVSLSIVAGLFVAEFVHHNVKSPTIKGLITVFLILPLATAPVAVGIIGRLVFTPQYGIVNVVLQRLGLIHGEILWFSTPPTALFTVAIMDVWQWTPFVVLIMLAGLGSIPTEIYEAANLDGANAWDIFRKMDLDYLRPLLMLCLLLRLTDEFRVFDIIMVMTQGGPGFSTETIAVYLYRVSFKYFDLSYGTTLAIIILLMMLGISLLVVRLLWREVIEPSR